LLSDLQTDRTEEIDSDTEDEVPLPG